MNLAETHDLLTLVGAFDNRKFGDETVIAWHDVLGDLAVGDCRAAVRRHFSTSDAYLMPVHIRRHVADIRQDRQRGGAVDELRAIEADPTRRDRSAEVNAILAELRATLNRRTA